MTTFTVTFEGRVPKTLREFALKNAHKVYEVTQVDGEQWRYDAACRPGWAKCDDVVHVLNGETVRELVQEIRDAGPCDCARCVEWLQGGGQ